MTEILKIAGVFFGLWYLWMGVDCANYVVRREEFQYLPTYLVAFGLITLFWLPLVVISRVLEHFELI